jgi:hypothetical protein
MRITFMSSLCLEENPRGLSVAGKAPAEGAHPRPFDGSGIPEKPDFGWAAGRSQLEPSLEREGAGGRSRPSLTVREGRVS